MRKDKQSIITIFDLKWPVALEWYKTQRVELRRELVRNSKDGKVLGIFAKCKKVGRDGS